MLSDDDRGLSDEQAIENSVQDAPSDASESEWKPKKLRTLMVPQYCVPVPRPVSAFDRISLRRVVRYETRNDLITIHGRLVVAEKQINGRNRYVAALLDGKRNKVWIDADPSETALYNRLLQLNKRRVTLFGRVFLKDRHWFIENPEPMPKKWLGKPRPVYNLHHATRRSLERNTEDELIESYLKDAKMQNEYRRSVNDSQAFARYLTTSNQKLLMEGMKDRESRFVGTGFAEERDARKFLVETLWLCHFPQSNDEFELAMNRVGRIGATCVAAEKVLESIAENERRLNRLSKIKAPRISAKYTADPEGLIDRWSAHIPFPLTGEQRQAVREILDDLASGMPMKRILSGDVGSGKTAVFAVAVAAMVDAGHRVAVILPSAMLATQAYKKLTEFIPNVKASMIAGDSRIIDQDALLWVGTVGVHSNAEKPFSFVVIDEQQRFARSQREAALTDNGHSLEVTATCIPRTQALIDAKMLDISILRECHVEKNLVSRICEQHDRAALFNDIAANIAAGEIIMVIYSGREEGSVARDGTKIHSVKEHMQTWERRFPGKVVACHGAQKSDENEASVEAVRAGRAQILVATSIVEVGIDIEGVRRVVVVQPERFGMATLHQLRGRAARDGGVGYFDMVLVNDIKKRAYKRLEYMAKTSDGFELANYDLNDRGAGDIVENGHRQSGQMPDSPFPDTDIDPDVLQQIWDELRAAYIEGIDKETQDDLAMIEDLAASG